jgi:hypothetical protein
MVLTRWISLPKRGTRLTTRTFRNHKRFTPVTRSRSSHTIGEEGKLPKNLKTGKVTGTDRIPLVNAHHLNTRPMLPTLHCRSRKSRQQFVYKRTLVPLQVQTPDCITYYLLWAFHKDLQETAYSAVTRRATFPRIVSRPRQPQPCHFARQLQCQLRKT